MPAMPRSNKKATKIAYAILGVPSMISSKPSKKEIYLRNATRGIATRYVKGAQYGF